MIGNNRDWLNTQYQQLFGREGDQAGLDYWNNQLNGGMSQADVIQSLKGSQEYSQRQNQSAPAPTQDINAQMRDLYNQGYSGGQLAAKAKQMGITEQQFAQATGLTPEIVRQAYAGSAAYQNGVGTPDRNVPGSTGYANPNDNVGFLTSLYGSVLNRAPDQGGLDYWIGQLNSGKSKEEVEKEFRTGAQQEINRPSVNRSTAANTNPYGVQTGNAFAGSQNPYVQAAQQNALGNLAAAQSATAANRVNQSTPFGDLQYTQSGFDANGNPIWNAKQTLAPGMQQAADNIQRSVAQQTANPFDASATQNQMINASSPAFQMMGERPELQTNVEGTGMSGWDRANELLMSRLRPQMEQRNAALDAKLANQGIMPGTEAYQRARMAAGQADNDLMVQAQLGGSQVQNQMFNQNLASGQFRNQALGAQNQMGLQNLGFNNAAMQQGFGNEIAKGSFNNAAQQNNFQQNLAAYNNPLQQLNAFRQGSAPNYVNPYNQQPSAGPDYFGAFTTSMANDIAAQNAQLAAQQAKQSGMVDLGVAGLLGSGGLSGIMKTTDWLTGKVKSLF